MCKRTLAEQTARCSVGGPFGDAEAVWLKNYRCHVWKEVQSGRRGHCMPLLWRSQVSTVATFCRYCGSHLRSETDKDIFIFRRCRLCGAPKRCKLCGTPQPCEGRYCKTCGVFLLDFRECVDLDAVLSIGVICVFFVLSVLVL